MVSLTAVTDLQKSTYDFVVETLRARYPNMDLSPGSSAMNNLVVPAVQLLSPLVNRIMRFDLMQDPALRDYVTDEEADLFVGRYGFVRKAGAAASGTVLFQCQLPTGDTFTIPAYTTITTLDADGNTLDYYVPEDTTFPADTFYAYINAAQTLYEFPAKVYASRYGSRYNLTEAAALKPVSAIPGCVGVRPVGSIQGGTDAESNLELFARFDKSFLGHELGNVSGYSRRLMELFPEIQDVYVAGYLDPLMIRDVLGSRHIGGKVDLWIKGSVLSRHTASTLRQQALYLDLGPGWLGDKSGVVAVDGGLGGLTLGRARFGKDYATQCLFHFDENQGRVTVDAASGMVGLLRDGTIWCDGYVGSALQFDGQPGSGVTVPFTAAQDLGEEYLVSATVRLDTSPDTLDGYPLGTVNLVQKTRTVHPGDPSHSSGLCWQLALVDGYPAWFVSDGKETRCYKTDERRVALDTFQTVTVRRYRDLSGVCWLAILLNDATLLTVKDTLRAMATPQLTEDLPGPLEIGFSSERGEVFRGAIDEVYVSRRPNFEAVTFAAGGLHEGVYTSTPREVRTSMLEWKTLELDLVHPNASGTDVGAERNGATAWTVGGVAVQDVIRPGTSGASFDASADVQVSRIVIDLGQSVDIAAVELENGIDADGTREVAIEWSDAANLPNYGMATPEQIAALTWVPVVKDQEGNLKSSVLTKRGVGQTLSESFGVDGFPRARLVRVTLLSGWGGTKKGLARIAVRPHASTQAFVQIRTAHDASYFDLPSTHPDCPVWRNPYAPFPHTDMTVEASSQIPLNQFGGRFIQVRVTLKTAHPFVRPVLKSARVHYAMKNCVALQEAPVHRVVSVMNTGVSGSKSVILPYALLYLDVDPEYLTDTARSSQESAFVSIPDLGPDYDEGDDVVVTYEVNDLAKLAQDYIDDRGQAIVTTDVLVKAAYPLYVYADLVVLLRKDVTGTVAVEAWIRQVLSAYLEQQALGARVDQSDLVAVLHANIQEIERVYLPFSGFFSDGNYRADWNAAGRSVQTIQATSNSYLTLGGVRVAFK